jgi:hypothetical protein
MNGRRAGLVALANTQRRGFCRLARHEPVAGQAMVVDPISTGGNVNRRSIFCSLTTPVAGEKGTQATRRITVSRRGLGRFGAGQNGDNQLE